MVAVELLLDSRQKIGELGPRFHIYQVLKDLVDNLLVLFSALTIVFVLCADFVAEIAVEVITQHWLERPIQV